MSLTHLTDFPDKLSPMLVKELRQGMRARGFTMLFLVFQGLLAFILLSAGAASGSDNAGGFASGVIFFTFSVAALVIQPMRGMTALSAEISGNTIEMMVLTRLSAWRIVFGKWVAIVSQTALILITIIPYLILRYFFGGMVLVGEIVFLGLIFLTSMALTAVMVGLSGNSIKLLRVLPVLGFIFILQAIPAVIFRGGSFNNFMNYCTLADSESRIAVFSYVSFVVYFGWCALSHGTSVIAPAAENHSTIRRLVALGLACITTAISFHPAVDYRILPAIFGIILAPAVLTALTEPSNLLPPICKPFLKLGLAGRTASLFLLPGWPAGVFYTTLLLAIGFGTFLVSAHSPGQTPSYLEEISTVSLSLTGGILLPALLASCFSKLESKRLTNFIVFLLGLVVLTILPAIFAGMNDHEKYLWLFIWNPLIVLPMMDDSSISKTHLLNAVIAVDAIILVLLLARAGIAFRGYREIIREAEDGLSNRTAPVPSTPAP